MHYTAFKLNPVEKVFTKKSIFIWPRPKIQNAKFGDNFVDKILDAKIWGEMRNGAWGLPEKITFPRLIGNSKQLFTVEV